MKFTLYFCFSERGIADGTYRLAMGCNQYITALMSCLAFLLLQYTSGQRYDSSGGGIGNGGVGDGKIIGNYCGDSPDEPIT